MDHAEAIGFGPAWAQAQDRAWVVRQHRITYRRPLVYGDVVLVTTTPERLSGARGWRRTEIQRESDAVLVAEALTEWTWIRTDGRPARLRRPVALLRIPRAAPTGLIQQGTPKGAHGARSTAALIAASSASASRCAWRAHARSRPTRSPAVVAHPS